MAPQKRRHQQIQKDDKGESEELNSDVDTEQKRVRWREQSPVDGDPDSDEDAGATEKSVLAAWCSHGRVGCAHYDHLKCILYVLEDTQETMHFDLTKMLLEQTGPDVILTSSRADDEFIDTLRDHADTTGDIFQIRPHKEFAFTKGRERLLSLSRLSELLPDASEQPLSAEPDNGVPRNAYDFMQKQRKITGDPTLTRWNASIRLANFATVESSPLCIASVGALLDHLVRERALGDFDDNGIGGLDISDIEILSLDQALQINSDALLSLQIFENESHASVHSDRTKEGLSLFGTLNGTKTILGRSLLRTWLLRPSLSLNVINSRHDAVTCFLRAENIITADSMHDHLRGIKNVPRILMVMKSGRAKLVDWQGLVKFTFHATMLRDTLMELHHASDIDIMKKLLPALDVASFKEVGTRINDIIDWAESTEAGRVCVRPHVDEELDNRKHVYHGIDDVLSKVAEQISQIVPVGIATSLNVVYFPQLGYLICVPMLKEWETGGIPVIDGWTFQFSSDAHVYFKSQEMHDMDTHIGDLHSTIVDREIEIIQKLLGEVLVYHEVLGHACYVCAELDCLLCFAEVSRTYDYTRPTMVDENVINIEQGRHPLHEQVVSTFVPNDAHIVGGAGSRSGQRQNSILLCTGANACGKSVYLKQIALIQFMAQIGCFVPAKSATLGIVDKIFTRVSTRESVSKIQSAFMIDLNQVSLALRNCTARSLVILDEFGKGTLSTGSYSFLSFFAEMHLNLWAWGLYWLLVTNFDQLSGTQNDYTDGAGLFCGVLQHLLGRGADCPKVLVATHFHDVFVEGILDPDIVSITFCHMQVMFTSSDGAILGGHQANVSLTSPNSESNTAEASRCTREVISGDKITYLYRVAEGLSLDSHAAKCAELFGVPSRIVQRAQYVSQLISTHETGLLLDEEMTEEERADLKDAEAICRRFLAWNLDEAEEEISVKQKLACVLGRSTTDD